MAGIVLAMTGASGAPYAVRLLETLLHAGRDVHLVISDAAKIVLTEEMGFKEIPKNIHWEDLLLAGRGDLSQWADLVHGHEARDFAASIASGSFPTEGMVICPCSGSTLAAVANGCGTNLIHRAAEVHLKERRKLILVTRETPLSLVQIENMRAAHLAGATILPASPGFYHRPDTVDDVLDFVVARICDLLGVPHTLSRRWGAEP
jgi:4-hydroxy-3-polyprenylbenzoate decarboxylase